MAYCWLVASLWWLVPGLPLEFYHVWRYFLCGPTVGWVDVAVGEGFFLFDDIESFLHSMDLTLNLFIVRRNQSDLTTWQKIEGVVSRRWEFLGRCPRSCIESEKKHGISK